MTIGRPMFTRFRSATPYIAPLFVGVCFLAAARLPTAIPPAFRAAVVAAAFLAALAAVAAAALAASLGVIPLRRSMHLALTPTVLAASAFGLFLVVERDLARYAVAGATMLLLGAHFAFVAGMREGARYGAEELGHISFAVHVVACFFCLGFVFGAAPLIAVPDAALAAAAGLFIGLVAWETLWHEGFAVRQFIPVAAAFGVLGAEFTAALSFLPTAPLVNAAVALILLVSALHAAVRILKGAALLRRQAVLTLTLVVLVLYTARWA